MMKRRVGVVMVGVLIAVGFLLLLLLPPSSGPVEVAKSPTRAPIVHRTASVVSPVPESKERAPEIATGTSRLEPGDLGRSC